MSASTSDQYTSWSGSNGPRQVDPAAAPTHYDLLGVPYSASQADITRVYRRAMQRAHPDHQSSARRTAAEEHAKQLNAAYAVLSKPARRLEYDRTIRQEVVQDQIMSHYVGGSDTAMGGHHQSAGNSWPTYSPADRREQVLSDRQALISLLIVFGGITGAVLAGLVLWSVIAAVASALF